MEKAVKYSLQNGLTVIAKEMHHAPVISVWVWYRVGSRYEHVGITGAAHFIEHLKGVRNHYNGVPITSLMDQIGGVYNAATSFDFTTFYVTLPSSHVNKFLEISAAQMKTQSLESNAVELERTVVISEREWQENDPLSRLYELVLGTAFQVHPYRHLPIGYLEDLQSITTDDLHNFISAYYSPNNAVMTITGDFQTGPMLEQVKKYFSNISPGEILTPYIISEHLPKGERRVVYEGEGDTTYIVAAYLSPPASHSDFFPLLIVDSLLTGPSSLSAFGGSVSNKTAQLYKALVEQEFAVEISGGLWATVDPYVYEITIILHPERTVHECITALDDEIKRIQDELPSEEILERAVKQARALFAYSSESITNQAFWLGFTEMFATSEWFTKYLDNLAAVTPEDVQRIARQYLRPQNRILGTYIPTGNNGSKGVEE